MHTVLRLAASAWSFLLVLFIPASLFSQIPIEGTWRINLDQSKLSEKPIVISVNKSMYECSSCVPPIKIKADGTDQPVTGHPFDTISVRVVDPKSITETAKKGGRIVLETTVAVSADGNTQNVKQIFHPPSGPTMNSEVTALRVGKAPDGAHAVSGSWRLGKVKESDNGRTFTYKTVGDEVRFSDGIGISYTAKLDGKDYPMKGSYGLDSVSLKRLDERTFEETSKRNGKPIEIWKMTVAPDGKKITATVTDVPSGRVSTYVVEKQP